jgi:hypothetical protein
MVPAVEGGGYRGSVGANKIAVSSVVGEIRWVDAQESGTFGFSVKVGRDVYFGIW